MLLPSVCFSKAHNNQGWTRLKSGAKNSTQVSHVVASAWTLELLSAASQITSRKLGRKQGWDSILGTQLMLDVVSQADLTFYTVMTTR